MSICLLLFNMSLHKTCGSSQYTRYIAEALGKMGHNVWVIVNKDHIKQSVVHAKVVEVDTPPYGSWFNCLTDPRSLEDTIHKYTQALLRLYVRHKIDILNVQHCLFSTVCGAFLKMMHNIPMIATCHGSETHESQGRQDMLAFLKFAKFADKIVAVSPSIINDIVAFTGISKKQIALITPGVDTVKFNIDRNTREKTRDVLDIKEGEILLIFVGRLIKEKGADKLPDIFAKLTKEQNLKFKLVVIGEGILEQELIRRMQNYVSSKQVYILGGVSHEKVAAYLQAADIALFPTQWNEPFTMAGLEAMASTLPVVSTNMGGLAKIIDDNNLGLVTDFPTPLDHFVDLILKLAEDTQLRTFFGWRARKFVQKRYDWSVIAKHLENLYLDYV